MNKNQFISAISILLNRGQDENTLIFKDRNHDEMVKELRDYLDLNKEYLGGNVFLNFTQALNDHGVDLLLEIPDRVKIGFQIKSHVDVADDRFAANVKRQFAESFAHGLDKWFLIICAPYNDGSRNLESRISHLINEMSMFKTNAFAIYNPRHAAALFQQMNTMPEATFNLEYQKLSAEPVSSEEIFRVIQGLLSPTDQNTARSFLAGRRSFTSKPPTSLAKINQVLNWNNSDEELKSTIESCKEYLKRLESLTQQSREFLTGILERATESVRGEKMRALCREVENHLGIDGNTAKKEIEVLEQARMAYYDDDWGRDTFIVGDAGVDWPIVVSLVIFAQAERIPLEKIFSEMDFTVLD